MRVLARDFWDWTVIVGVPLFGVLSLAAAVIALRRTRTIVRFGANGIRRVRDHPTGIEVWTDVRILTSGAWQLEELAPRITVTEGSSRRQIPDDEMQFTGRPVFPSTATGPVECRATYRFWSGDATKVRMRLYVKIGPHGRGTFRKTFTVPPEEAPSSPAA